MKNALLNALAESQTGTAKKVLSAVPLAERWGVRQIMTEMYRLTGSRQDLHIVQGCLSSLADSGLIRESAAGFQRVAPKPEPEPKPEATPMQKPTPAVTPRAAAPAPFDRLLTVGEKLRALGIEATSLATEIDAAALAFEETASAPNEELAKLRQLQSLLKSLS